jgi:large subunit ribosomal protein L4
MISAKRFTSQGVENGNAQLPESHFGEKINDHVMWLSVCSYLAAQRQGTHSVKNRRIIRGGGRKPFRQKGTGMARQGTRRAPQMRGGARAFGPRPHDYKVRLPRKVRALGIRSALSLAAKEGRIMVVDDLAFEAPRTKLMAEVLGKMGVGDGKCMLITGQADRNTVLSGRNLPRLVVTTVGQLNTYELLNTQSVVITQGALEKLTGEADDA